MTDLVQFIKDGIEVYVDHNTGETFASVSGYSRMANKAQSTISERLAHRKTLAKTAEVQTAQGLQPHRLLSEDTITDWLPQDNPVVASQMLKLGVRKFMHTIAGYKHKQSKPLAALPQDYIQALEALVASEKEKQQLQLQAAKDAPKVELATAFIDRDGLTLIGDFAKDIACIGRNNLFKLLRQKEVLMRNNHPYQRYIERGFFVLKPAGWNSNIGRESYTTLLTPAGVQWLNEQLKQWLTK